MDKKFRWQCILVAMVFGLCTAMPAVARADGGAPWDSALTTLVNYMTGSTAKLLATLAVAALGFMAMTGRVAIRTVVSIVLGIAIVFGATSIVEVFSK